LPNFHECWWDHWIVDVTICNFAGMVLGLMTCRYLEMVRYDWTGSSTANLSPWARFRRLLKQFSPYTWTKYEWEVFKNLKRFLYVLFSIVVMEIMEMNGFFLKYVLWIPPPNPLNSYRLLILWLLSMPALREWYEYVTTEGSTRRLGKDMWLLLAIMGAELAVCLKFGWHLFKTPPAAVFYSWTFSLLLLTLWVLFRFDIVPVFTRNESKTKNRKRVLLNLLFVASLLPMGYLVYSQDVGYGEVGREIIQNTTTVEEILKKEL